MSFLWNDLLVNPMINALIIMSNALLDNFGLAIIAFTIFIRLVTFPLTIRQLRTTRAMQEMQPQMQEIQKKYKDPKRRQQEMMKLYREVGFNPLGCLVPFAVQIPIWIALFQVIRRTVGTTPGGPAGPRLAALRLGLHHRVGAAAQRLPVHRPGGAIDPAGRAGRRRDVLPAEALDRDPLAGEGRPPGRDQ